MFSFSSKRASTMCLLLSSLWVSQTAFSQDLAVTEEISGTTTQSIALAPETQQVTATEHARPKAEAVSAEAQLARQQKAMAHLKAMLSVKEEKTAVKQITPYEQLVKLAFKGKGENGINSYQDAAKVFCQQARDNNDPEAQFALGWMFAQGKGFSKDENIAAMFYNKAAAQNHYRAKKALINFKGNETLAQTPQCMLPDEPEEPLRAEFELAPAGSNGNDFYERGPIFDIVERLAPQYHIETDLVMAFIKTESNFNPKATSPKNAQGLMQLIPATARRFGVRDSYDPEQNIKGGLAYLQWLMAYYEGDVRLVAAAYNAGEGAVDRYKGIPPYRETKNYVRKIYKLYRKSYHPFKQDLLIGERSRIVQASNN